MDCWHVTNQFLSTVTRTILIIEPGGGVLSDQLQHDDFLTLSTQGVQEAITIIASRQVDLILIDGCSDADKCYQTCITVKNNIPSQKIPIMLIFSEHESGFVEKSFNSGAEDYLQKPFIASKAHNRIEWLIQKSLRQRSETKILTGQAHLQSEFKKIKSALLQTSFYDLSILGNPIDENLKLALSIILSAPLLPKKPAGSIYLTDIKEKNLRLACQLGLKEELTLEKISLNDGKRICKQVLDNKTIHFQTSEEQPHDNSTTNYTGHYIVPIMREQGRVLGILNIYLEKGLDNSNELEQFLADIAMILAIIISRKYYETRLIISENRFSSIANTSYDGIISIDHDNLIIFANRSAHKIFQYEDGELIGKPTTILVPEQFRQRHENALQKALSTNKLSHTGQTIELLGLRQGGGEFPIEISLSMWETAGHFLFAAFIRDISERKKIEEKIRLQSASMAAAANSIMITDTDGIIEWVNPAFEKLTGYTFKEVVGRNANILNSAKHPKLLFQELWNTIKAGNNWHGQLQNRKKNGELFWEELTITPIFNQEGNTSHFLAIKVDVTAKKEIDEALWRAKIEVEASRDELATINKILMEERNIIENVVLKIRHSPLFNPTNLQIIDQPLEKNSGDLICAAKHGNGSRRVLLGDFAGHGLTAAIAGPLVSEIFYAIGMDMPFAAMFSTLNKRLLQALSKDMFMACSSIELNPEKNQVSLFNAGMVNILIIRNGTIIHSEPSRFVPRGLMDVPDETCTVFPVKRGDRIIMCTDGFEEATDPNGKMLGEAGFIKILEEILSQNKTLNSILGELEAFRRGGEQEDDMTLIELTC